VPRDDPAYYYLWKYAPPQGWNSGQLDDFIEMELEGKLNLKIDFEVDDANRQAGEARHRPHERRQLRRRQP